MSLKTESILIFKYLIQIKKNKAFAQNALNHYLFRLLCDKGIHNLLRGGNQINLENNNLVLFFYSHDRNRIVWKNRNKIHSKPKNTSRTSIKSNTSEDSILSTICITRHNLEFNKKVTIIFQIDKKKRVEISIEFNKKIKQLIKLFFRKIGRLDLFNDKEIFFYCFNKYIPHNSEDLIGNMLGEKLGTLTIVVQDPEKKIKI